MYVVKISNSQTGNFKSWMKSFIMHRSIRPRSLMGASIFDVIFWGNAVVCTAESILEKTSHAEIYN